jgi:hypothetical protein
VFDNSKLGFVKIEQKSEGMLDTFTRLKNPDVITHLFKCRQRMPCRANRRISVAILLFADSLSQGLAAPWSPFSQSRSGNSNLAGYGGAQPAIRSMHLPEWKSLQRPVRRP